MGKKRPADIPALQILKFVLIGIISSDNFLISSLDWSVHRWIPLGGKTTTTQLLNWQLPELQANKLDLKRSQPGS